MEPLGVCMAALILIQSTQIYQSPADNGVIWPERFLIDFQRTLEKRLGVGIAAPNSQ